MPTMYEVYSQQRPGRPRWAMGSSAALLLLTVLLAAALIHHKVGPGKLPLEQFTTPLFRGVRPVGWKEITSELPAATEAAWAEPTKDQTPGRACFLFRRVMWPLAAPPDRLTRSAAREYALEVFSLFVPGSRVPRRDANEPSPTQAEIAGTTGLTMQFKCVTPDGQSASCLVCCTVLAPSGGSMITPVHVIGIAILVPGEPGLAENRLLDRMSHELSIGGAQADESGY